MAVEVEHFLMAALVLTSGASQKGLCEVAFLLLSRNIRCACHTSNHVGGIHSKIRRILLYLRIYTQSRRLDEICYDLQTY